jgi:cation transport regulator
MPYKTNKSLPKRVKSNLPSGAQTIYRKAFNNAMKQYKDKSDTEKRAHKVAWAAVKKEYMKKADKWVKK